MPIAMRRRDCASGAVRPSSVPMSRRSPSGSIGPSPRARMQSQRQRDACETIMVPKVLISDALSPAAVQIFKDRGVEVEFQPTLGGDKEKLAHLIGGFEGLAIRSATKVTPAILDKAKSLRVIGRAGIGVDNVDIPAATAKGIIVMNTPFGNSITTAEHAITLMLALA